jgi:hypothetical protein
MAKGSFERLAAMMENDQAPGPAHRQDAPASGGGKADAPEPGKPTTMSQSIVKAWESKDYFR